MTEATHKTLILTAQVVVAYVRGNHIPIGCNKGTCDNRRMIKREVLEDRVLGGLRDKLLHPDVIAAFVEEFQQEYNDAKKAEHAARQFREAELARVDQSIAQIVDAIADGMYHPSMKEKMTALEARKLTIQDDLRQLGEEEPLRLHPGLSGIYRRKVAALTDALNADETARHEAIGLLRGLVSTIRLTPDGSGELQIELIGELSAIMLLTEEDKTKSRHHGNGACSVTMVAGARNVFCYNLGSVWDFAPGNNVEDAHHLAA